MALCGACQLDRHAIPVPRMSQLLTNPILAALASLLANRRISAGFIVEAAAGPRHPPAMLASLTVHHDPRRRRIETLAS